MTLFNLPSGDTSFLAEHWPGLLGVMLVVFAVLYWRFGRGRKK